jgi:hypothetical protein
MTSFTRVIFRLYLNPDLARRKSCTAPSEHAHSHVIFQMAKGKWGKDSHQRSRGVERPSLA